MLPLNYDGWHYHLLSWYSRFDRHERVLFGVLESWVDFLGFLKAKLSRTHVPPCSDFVEADLI